MTRSIWHPRRPWSVSYSSPRGKRPKLSPRRPQPGVKICSFASNRVCALSSWRSCLGLKTPKSVDICIIQMKRSGSQRALRVLRRWPLNGTWSNATRVVSTLRAIWVVAVLWYECGVFYWSTAVCRWPDKGLQHVSP